MTVSAQASPLPHQRLADRLAPPRSGARGSAAALLLSAVPRLAWCALLLGLIWWLGGGASVLHGAPQHRLAAITLQLEPGQSVLLGRQQLAAPAADAQHLRLWREASGRWWFSNVSASRAVAWQLADREGQLRNLVLQAGQPLWVAGRRWLVQRADSELVLAMTPSSDAQATAVWHHDGARLWSADAQAVPATCPDQSLVGRLRQRWNAAVPGLMAWRTPLQWGGSVRCGNRMPEPALAPGELTVVHSSAGWQLQAGAAAARRVCLAQPEDQACPLGASLFEQPWPLDAGLRLTVGRTTLLAQAVGHQLRLVPVHRAGWVAQDAAPQQPAVVSEHGTQAANAHPAPVVWQLEAADPWRWSVAWPWYGVLVAALAVWVGLAAWLHLWHGTAQGVALAMAAALVMAVASLALLRLGQQVGPALALCWAWLALLSVALLPGRTGWAWCSHALLATMLAMGLAAQWQLGRQGLDSGAWQYLHKTAAWGAFGLYALHALAWGLQARGQARHSLRLPGATGWELGLFALGVVAMVGLGLQAVLGSEEGLLGLVQPVELAKLALVLLGAHALAVRLEWAGTGGWRRWGLWWRLLAPMALFSALGATALLLLQDYSPVLLLALWLLGVTCAWALAASSWLAALLGLLAVGAGAGGWFWLQHGDGHAWMLAHGFYGERFSVWLDPLHHPHSGEQVLRALRLAAQGGWWGDGLAPAWRVPAVQDDMAPAFLTGRFGLAAALLLVVLQALYLASVLLLGWQALCAVQPGDYRRRWALRLLFFAAWGAAALFAGHLLLSWGTNTGWLPVMGQPMPLVSAGGSVIVLLLVPLHLLWQLQPLLLSPPRQKLA